MSAWFLTFTSCSIFVVSWSSSFFSCSFFSSISPGSSSSLSFFFFFLCLCLPPSSFFLCFFFFFFFSFFFLGVLADTVGGVFSTFSVATCLAVLPRVVDSSLARPSSSLSLVVLESVLLSSSSLWSDPATPTASLPPPPPLPPLFSLSVSASPCVLVVVVVSLGDSGTLRELKSSFIISSDVLLSSI